MSKIRVGRKKKLNRDLFIDNICQLSRVANRSQTTHVLQEYETDKRDSLRHTPQLPKPISPLFLRFQERERVKRPKMTSQVTVR